MHSNELSPEVKQAIKAEMEYRESIERELASSRSKASWWQRISGFFSHAFIVAVLGGILIQIFQANQAAKQERLTRKEQLQDKQYTLLANFSDQFDQYMVLLINVRYLQVSIKQSESKPDLKDFIGRSRAELLSIYDEVVKQMLQHPRGEAVLVSIRALFHSQQVTKQLDELDGKVLTLQHGGPDDGKLTEAQIRNMDKDIDQLVRNLAVAMRQEMEANE